MKELIRHMMNGHCTAEQVIETTDILIKNKDYIEHLKEDLMKDKFENSRILRNRYEVDLPITKELEKAAKKEIQEMLDIFEEMRILNKEYSCLTEAKYYEDPNSYGRGE